MYDRLVTKENFMATVLYLIFIAVLILSSICVIFYIPRIFGWIYGFKKQSILINSKKNRFALIVPARNESQVISTLFDSLKKQTYDKTLFDTHVLVKTETDKTVDLTKEFGGIIHVIKEKVCKGHDINMALQKILKENPNKYDAYIVIDADCCLDKKFIEEMNNAMASGRQIIQAKKLVKNRLYTTDKKANNWVTRCNGLIWTMIDEIGNKFKSRHQIINMTIGTGIMLRSDVVKRLGGWPYDKTLTEDIELMYDSLCKGFTTYYYSRAKIYVEESTSLTETNKRRTRWMTGVVDSKRLYNKKVKSLPLSWKNIKNIYYANALTPAYWFCGVNTIACALFLTIGLVSLIFNPMLSLSCLMYAIVCFLSIYVGFFALTAFCLLVDRKTNKFSVWENVQTLFVHPLFYMGYIPIVTKALLGKQPQVWKVIERMDLKGKQNDRDN